MQLYSSTDTATSLENSRFILSERSVLSTTVHTFLMRMFASFSVDEILLPRNINWSNFRDLPFYEEMVSSWLKHMNCFICVHIETNTRCCLLLAMLQRFGLSRFIYEMCLIINEVRISFQGISSASIFSKNLTPFSFIRSLDVHNTSSRQIINRNSANVSTCKTPCQSCQCRH